MKIIRLSAAEEDVMAIFWELARPLTSVEILQQENDKTWTTNYLHKMLRKLEDEQFLKVCGMVRYGNQYARQFVPLVSQGEYMASMLKKQRTNIKSFGKIALAFAKVEDEVDTNFNETNEMLIKELEDIIAELRAKEKP